MANPKPYSRRERASFDLNVVSSTLCVLRDKDPVDLIVFLTIAGCRHITQVLTVDYIRASLDLTDNEIEKHLRSLQKKGWIVRDEEFLAITEEGKAKEKEIRYNRFEIYRRYERKRKKDGGV